MGTDGRLNGANSPIDPWQHGNEGGVERGDWREMRQLDPRVGPLHRETACPGGTQGGPNCLTHSPPRCFPTPNLREADGNGYIRDGRAEGALGPPPVLASVNLVPLLWTGVPTPSTPVDRQDPLPILRCPGKASCCVRVFPDHLITERPAHVPVLTPIRAPAKRASGPIR